MTNATQPTDLDGTGVRWQRKQAAMRDLILRMLCGTGGVILDQSGGIASRIREHYGIPESRQAGNSISTVLGLMEQAGLIKRRMNEARTCTYSIELIVTLDEVQIIELEFYRSARLHAFLGTVPDPNGPGQILSEVQTGYAAIQGGARAADYRDSEGMVAINVTRLLDESGFSGQRARRIRYYLRTLELAKSGRKHEGDQKLWLWSISDEEIPLHRLMALIVGDQNFEDWDKAQTARKAARRPADAATAAPDQDEDDSADDTTPVQPVATPRPGPPPGRRAAVRPIAAQATTGDTTEQLLGIITGLETEVERLTSEATTADKRHAEALAAKDEIIAGLQRQLAERRQVDDRAASVIARYSSE